MDFSAPLSTSSRAVRRATSDIWQVDPTWWICLVALSTLMFAQLSQTIAVVIFMAAVMACAITRPREVIHAIWDSAFLWPFLLYAMLSVIWSQAPELTFRYTIQLIFTVGAATFIARALTPRAFVSAIIATWLIATVASIVYVGPALIVQWQSRYPIQGIFVGSKNSFGGVEAVFILAGLHYALDRTRPWITRLFMISCLCLAAELLIGSRSATPVLALGPALVCSIAARSLARFNPRGRALILVSTVVVSVLLTAMLLPVMQDLYSALLDASGRNATLTGRTLLWAWADRIIADRPLLGFGYEAFWVKGSPYPEAIWAQQGMDWRSGLSFHNQWYEIAVELGYIGLALALTAFLTVAVRVVLWALRRPSAESCFFLGFLVYTAIRTYVEVDLFAQFDFTFIIFIASYAYAQRENGGRTISLARRRPFSIEPGPRSA